MSEIREVSPAEAEIIIDIKQPLGKFYTKEDVLGEEIVYVGIDNSTGEAWIEVFRTKEECITWLNEEDPKEGLNKEEIYRQALEKWGADLQIVMVFEEMSELQKELCKSLRGKENRIEIAEEIADVEIMLEQMKIYFSIEEAVEKYREYKIERLAKRLEEENIQRCRVCGCTWNNACEGGCYWVEEDLCSKCAKELDK